jgi:UDP-2,3-diacylglucosamine pyrophosphatase LpxH
MSTESAIRGFTVLEKSRNVHTIKHVYHRRSGWEQWYLLTADHHWDNPKCKRDLLKKHFDQAKERNAGIFLFGDTFCAMQGKYDPRASKADIRPEHNKPNYLDALVNTAADWYAPYAENIILVTVGNHESSILKRQETDLIERFVHTLNLKGNPEQPVCKGGYSGYVRFAFEGEAGSERSSKKLWYHHGHGGGGVVTKGVIQSNRRAAFVADADIVVGGHIHEAWQLEVVKQRMTAADQIVLEEQLHICTPTYKEEYGDGHGGWHIERGAPPKPLGGQWLRFYYENERIKFEVTRAK